MDEHEYNEIKQRYKDSILVAEDAADSEVALPEQLEPSMQSAPEESHPAKDNVPDAAPKPPKEEWMPRTSKTVIATGVLILVILSTFFSILTSRGNLNIDPYVAWLRSIFGSTFGG